MSDSFSAMKKNRGTSKLSEKLASISGSNTNSYQDERIWKPTPDKSGNYSGIIRFLPAPRGEDSPFIKVFNHGFQKNGKWFIENCPTSLGQDCPVCEANSELWNSGIESDKKIASQRKRKTSYYANIIVINDPANPENNGRNFLYRFGTKIMEKIEAVAAGDPTLGEDGIDVQDFWDGANLVLKMRKGDGGYTTYQDSQFQAVSQLFDGDEDQLKALWESLHSLQEYHDPTKFLGYDELKTKFDKFVFGRSSNSAPSRDNDSEEDTKSSGSSQPNFNPHKSAPESTEEAPFKESKSSDSGEGGGDESPLAKFKALTRNS